MLLDTAGLLRLLMNVSALAWLPHPDIEALVDEAQFSNVVPGHVLADSRGGVSVLPSHATHSTWASWKLGESLQCIVRQSWCQSSVYMRVRHFQ